MNRLRLLSNDVARSRFLLSHMSLTCAQEYEVNATNLESNWTHATIRIYHSDAVRFAFAAVHAEYGQRHFRILARRWVPVWTAAVQHVRHGNL